MVSPGFAAWFAHRLVIKFEDAVRPHLHRPHAEQSTAVIVALIKQALDAECRKYLTVSLPWPDVRLVRDDSGLKFELFDPKTDKKIDSVDALEAFFRSVGDIEVEGRITEE